MQNVLPGRMQRRRTLKDLLGCKDNRCDEVNQVSNKEDGCGERKPAFSKDDVRCEKPVQRKKKDKDRYTCKRDLHRDEYRKNRFKQKRKN
jgi:hypothetical protein